MRITIIDDEKILASKIWKKLQNNWYSINLFHGYQDFMQNGDANSALYIIDISLQDGSGFDIVQWLRKSQNPHVPVIIISGYWDSHKIIYWLDIWADDYLTKPFVPEELLARVKAVLRRPATETIAKKTIKYKKITYCTETKMAQVGTNSIYFTKNEARILEYFLMNQGHVISRAKLIGEVWWWDGFFEVTDNTINVTLSKIRKKLWENFALKAVYNQGYILE